VRQIKQVIDLWSAQPELIQLHPPVGKAISTAINSHINPLRLNSYWAWNSVEIFNTSAT